MDNKKIGLFIISLRKEKNMTQKTLAEKLFVSDKAVSKWERGICMPDIGLIQKLADILDVSVSDILKGEKIEQMTKQSSDEIVKESIPFFQKEYFKRKTIKMVASIIIFLLLGYFFLFMIGEMNNGQLKWSIWGTDYYMNLPSFSAKKSQKNIETFIKALQEYNYDKINNILLNDINRTLYNNKKNITFEEYRENLEHLRKENFRIEKYKCLYCDYDGQVYYCQFEFAVEHNKIKYSMSARLRSLGNFVTVHGLDYSLRDSFKINNPVTIRSDNFYEIEKIFVY